MTHLPPVSTESPSRSSSVSQRERVIAIDIGRGRDTPDVVFRLLYYCSTRVTSLYVIQWTLIAWGLGIVGFQTMSPAQTIALMPITLGATFAVQALWERTASALRAPEPAERGAVT